MNHSPIRILHLEDIPRDAQLIQDFLDADGNYEIVLVSNRLQFQEALGGAGFDVILCNVNIPDFDGLSALKLAKEKKADTPVIITSEANNSEETIRFLQAGATDNLLKHRLERAPSAIKRAVEEAETQRQRQKAEALLWESEERFRQLAEHSSEVFWFTAIHPERIEYVSPAVERVWGHQPEHFYKDPRAWAAAIHPDDRTQVQEVFEDFIQNRSPGFEVEYRIVRPDGSLCWVQDTGTMIRDRAGNTVRIAGVTRDITERKLTQNATLIAEERYQKLFENIIIGIFQTTLDGHYSAVNPALAQMYGYASPDDLLAGIQNIEYQLYLNPDRRQEFIRAMEKQGQVSGFESQIKRKDGSIIWISETAHGVCNAEGKVVEFAGTVENINERKAAERALAESERFTRDSLDALGEHVAILDERGVIIAANSAWRKFALLNGGEVVRATEGVNYLEVCNAANSGADGEASPIAAGIESVMRGDTEEFVLEYSCHSPTEQRWFLCRITRFSGDGPVRVVVAHENVTLIKTVQEQLRESTETFRSLASVARVGIFRTDEQGRWNYMNRQCWIMTGLSEEEALGDGWSLAIHPEDRDRVLNAWIEAVRNHAPFCLEFRFLLMDGTVFWVIGEAAKLMDSNGDFTGHVGTIFNITERIQARSALEEERSLLARRVVERTSELSVANAELARASRLKSEFLANMSHELRTPLNAILGLSESLLEQRSGPLSERQQRAVRTIESSGRHLLTLINDILDVSKVEAGKLVLQIEEVNVREACEASIQFVQQQIMAKRLDFQFTCEIDRRPLQADPRRVKQIVVNLLSNSVKFTPDGGSIGLEIRTDPAESYIDFTAWDKGIGIAQEDQHRLFQPFVQVQTDLSREYEGTGLGLVLVQRLAEMHGGSVMLESELGHGSRFTVRLPWTHVKLASTSPPQVFARPGSELNKALIIEDERTASEQLEYYLQEMNIGSATHRQGAGALERAIQVKPDIILLDILLPDLSGWEVLRRLKEDKRTRHIPVVVISVLDEGSSPRAAGAFAYLVKPISREQLKTVLGHPKALTGPPAATGPLILLAEDNETNIQTIGDYLMDHGFRMLVARNGIEAIHQVRAEKPSLVLMDIQMPVMDGLEAIRNIRTDSAQARMPIIALTALAMPGDRERCLDAGADDYFSKPVILHDLALRISQLLDPTNPA